MVTYPLDLPHLAFHSALAKAYPDYPNQPDLPGKGSCFVGWLASELSSCRVGCPATISRLLVRTHASSTSGGEIMRPRLRDARGHSRSMQCVPGRSERSIFTFILTKRHVALRLRYYEFNSGRCYHGASRRVRPCLTRSLRGSRSVRKDGAGKRKLHSKRSDPIMYCYSSISVHWECAARSRFSLS